MKSIMRFERIVYPVFAGSFLFAVGAWCYPVFRPPEAINPGITPGRQEQMSRLQAEEIRPLSFYAQALEKKNIFGALFIEQAPDAHSPETDEVIKSIVLLGIISGADPQTIIEDTARQKTYFLRPGERMDERVTVERIEQGKVFLGTEGGTYELHL